MIGDLLLAAALTGASPAISQPAANPFPRMGNARVVRVSPRPGFMSGIVAVYADFDVAMPGKEPQRMYMLWMTMDQFLPEVGSICTIGYRRAPLLGGNLHRPIAGEGPRDAGPRNIVEDLSCGPPLELPAAVQRSPSAR